MPRPHPLGGSPSPWGAMPSRRTHPSSQRTNLQQADGRREGCPGQREQEARGSGERGVRTAEAGAGRAPLWEENRAPSCFPRPRPPAQGPVALHPDRGLGGECNLRGSCPSPPRPRLPAPASTPPLRQGSVPPPWDAPARSLWPPRPSPCASHACLLSPGAPRPCSRRRALVPRSSCPGGSMAPPHPPPLRPLPPSQWSRAPTSLSAPGALAPWTPAPPGRVAPQTLALSSLLSPQCQRDSCVSYLPHPCLSSERRNSGVSRVPLLY